MLGMGLSRAAGFPAVGSTPPRIAKIPISNRNPLIRVPIRHPFTTGIRTRAPQPLLNPSLPSSHPHRPITTTAATMSRHPDFKTTEASRPDWRTHDSIQYTKTANPNWKFGDGANSHDKATSETKHVAIDPYEPGRAAASNYKLLVSAITPRPVGFVSTRSGTGAKHDASETLNLAPFSFFNMVASDPPLFVMGVRASLAEPKDTLRNLVANGECTINIISEHFLEAANSACIDVPPSHSEWVVSGLTPMHDVETVSTPRVREAIFSAECRVDSIKEYESRVTPGHKSVVIVTVEAQRFWVREDALNEEKDFISADVLRPICRLGGISYGRVVEAVELPRPVFTRDLGQDGYEALAKKANGAAN